MISFMISVVPPKILGPDDLLFPQWMFAYALQPDPRR
jgi:hypothetical protein